MLPTPPRHDASCAPFPPCSLSPSLQALVAEEEAKEAAEAAKREKRKEKKKKAKEKKKKASADGDQEANCSRAFCPPLHCASYTHKNSDPRACPLRACSLRLQPPR